MTESLDKASLVLRGGNSIVDTKPIYSPDAKYVLCACGNIVKVLSISSGSCVRELREHTKRVTGLVINPLNRYQVLTSSEDQTIKKWDFTEGILLKTYHVKAPLYSMQPLASTQNNKIVAVQKTDKNAQRMVEITLPVASSQNNVHERVLMKQCSKSGRLMSVGCKSEYVASVFRDKLNISQFLTKGGGSNLKFYNHEKPVRNLNMTCIACHPTDYCIAVGFDDGRILLCYEIFSSKLVTTVLHWHAVAVKDLCFTLEGSYLLSGGHECTLVKWQHNSHHKDMLPRLGAPITGVVCAPDNGNYLTCHADNAIQVISNQFKVAQVFQGLTRAHQFNVTSSGDIVPAGLLHDPRSDCLVLNGKPGHLQFYSLNNDKHLFNLDIVGQNYVSPENLKTPLIVTDIERAAFSQSGEWLVTYERRDDGETTPEMRLKFWKWDKQGGNFVLNTCVDSPHKQALHSLQFRPTLVMSDNPMVVTTSSDGQFKLWSLSDDTDIYRENSCWQCDSVGFYRDEPASEACFSEDGSLLAVAFGGTLTLWDPSSNELRATLPHVGCTGKLRHIVMGSGCCSHMLLCAAEDMVCAWNLLTTAVQWTKKCDVNLIVQDPCSEYVALFLKNKSVQIIKPSAPDTIYSSEDISSSPVSSAIFMPRQQLRSPEELGCLSWQSHSQLYFMNDKQELYTFELESDLAAANDRHAQAVKEQLPETMLSQVLARAKNTALHKQGDHQPDTAGHEGAAYLRQMLLTPAHVLPPVDSVCLSFLQQLIISKHKNTTSSGEAEDSSDDEDMDAYAKEDADSDSDMEVNDSAPSKPSAGGDAGTEEDTQYAEKLAAVSALTFSWLQ